MDVCLRYWKENEENKFNSIIKIRKKINDRTEDQTNQTNMQVWETSRSLRTGNKIEGLLLLFWGLARHIPFGIFCNPSKKKG